jgi:hypothetical protein
MGTGGHNNVKHDFAEVVALSWLSIRGNHATPRKGVISSVQ